MASAWRKSTFLITTNLSTDIHYSAGDDPNAKPTARAITERLVKMRQMVKSNGAGHFSISGKNGSSSTPSTPRKPRTPSSVKTATPASGKGKHSATEDYAMLKSDPETIDSNDESIKNEHAIKTEDKDNSTVVKSERAKRESPATIFGEADTMDNTASPSKRVCTPRTYRMPGMESEAGDSYSGDSSDPEFLPEGPGA